MDWTDTLPTFDPAGLPTVFQEAADHARTDGQLAPAIRRHTSRAARHVFRNARKQTQANGFLDVLPQAGEVLHLVLDGSFDLCHLIPRILALAAESLDTLDLATLGFHDSTIHILSRLSDAGQIGRIRLLASHYFRSVDSSLWSRAHAALTSRGHLIYVARNHAKLQLYRFRSGRTISLMSSANLRSCRNAESAVIFGDPDVFRFWRSVVDELIREAQKCAAESQA